MNGKAGVSRDLNAKHLKILEGLLKFPENRDCADCRSRGPRWASVNLGIFICMQCSGIHRSLGVHISKVRSATLDTWLPDQVAFIQTMGNEKSNSYWEAELPPRYDRVGIENFIRAKYVEKRWIPRDVKVKSSSPVREKRTLETKPVSGTRSAGYAKYRDRTSEDRKAEQLHNNATANPSLRNSSKFLFPKLPKPVNTTNLHQVASTIKPQEVHHKLEPTKTQVTKEKPGEKASPVESASKLDYATDRSNKPPVEEAKQNDLKVSASVKQPMESINSNRLHSTETRQITEGKVLSNVAENRSKFDSGIEELLRDFQWNAPAVVGKPVEDAKNDIVNLNGKPNVALAMPFLVQQQPPPTLAVQQYIQTAATTEPWGVSQSHSTNINQASSNIQNWGGISTQTPGKMLQQMGSSQSLNAPAASTSPTSASMNNRMRMAPIGGISATLARPYQSVNKPAVVPTPSGRDYDFSFLLQGMYTKR